MIERGTWLHQFWCRVRAKRALDTAERDVWEMIESARQRGVPPHEVAADFDRAFGPAAKRRKSRDPASKPMRHVSRRDPVSGWTSHPGTITLRGRPYSVSTRLVEAGRSFAGERRYMLTGKRGGTYYTMRNVHRPHMMFVFSNAPRSNVLEGVWLTDEGGALRVVRQ